MSTAPSYDPACTFEVLHTAHVLIDTWSQHVTETMCAEQFADLKAAAVKAEEAMAEVYQLAARKYFDHEV